MSKFWIGVALIVFTIIASIFGGMYLSIRYNAIFKTAGLFASLILVFLLTIFIQMENRRLNRGEVRRAIAVTLVTALLMIMFFGIEIDSNLRSFFLGVLSTIIGFYFGYRKEEK